VVKGWITVFVQLFPEEKGQDTPLRTVSLFSKVLERNIMLLRNSWSYNAVFSLGNCILLKGCIKHEIRDARSVLIEPSAFKLAFFIFFISYFLPYVLSHFFFNSHFSLFYIFP